MPSTARDPLTLADLMILIAAIGLGLGGFILIDDNLYGGGRYFFGLFRPAVAWNASTILDKAEGAGALAMTAFGGWTLALPIMARLRPGSTRRRLARGPGVTACLSAMVGLAAVIGTTALAMLLRWVEGRTTLPPNYWYTVPVLECSFLAPGVAVMATWLTQIVTGRWRASPHLIDRLGRFVGALWASAALVFATRLFLA